jgi:hypothetical protein
MMLMVVSRFMLFAIGTSKQYRRICNIHRTLAQAWEEMWGQRLAVSCVPFRVIL